MMLFGLGPVDELPPTKREKEESKRATIIKIVLAILVLACIFALGGCASQGCPKEEAETTMPSLMSKMANCFEKATFLSDKKGFIGYAPRPRKVSDCLERKGIYRMPEN